MRRFFVGLAITAMLGMIPGQTRGDDRQISQTIVKKLQAEQKSKNLNGFNIDLEVDDGAVYLKGTVASEEQEQLTLDIVRRIDGVTQVYNELDIVAKETRAEETAPASEPEVVEEPENNAKVPGILSSLKKASTLSTRRVESSEKVVKPAATRSATTSVSSNSEVTSRDLAERIISRLKQEKAAGNLQGFAIDVEVDNGVAWLNGKVATAEQQTRVLEVVRRVAGVKQVVNGMTVTQPVKTATDIAQEVVATLQDKKASGELRNFTVDVEVDHGVVWLSGQAASEAQQQIILDTARYIPGVTKVVNDLVVKAPIVQAQQLVAKAGIQDADQVGPVMAPPQPLSIEEVERPIGSSVASGAAKRAPATASPAPAVVSQSSSQQPAERPASGTPASGLQTLDQPAPNLQAVQPGRQTVQYMWVPASQMPAPSAQVPLAFAPAHAASHSNVVHAYGGPGGQEGQPMPINASVPGMGIAPARFDHPQMPQYSWPSYAPYPNYGAVTYPKQYSPMAWPYIGPFYPYPQVPLGWRKVELKWKDGWWQLDFKDRY